MKKSRFTDQRIVIAMQQAQAGVAVEEVCQKLEINQQTFRRWKKKFAGVGVPKVRRPHRALVPAEGDSLAPTDVYVLGRPTGSPRWRTRARAAQAILDKMMEEAA